MTSAHVLPLSGFYQFGYVTPDLDAAEEVLRQKFGIARVRRKRNSAWMEAIHAWTGDGTQIEVLQLGDDAPAFYLDYVPEISGRLRLHHHGHRIETAEQWDAMEAAVAALGLETPLKAELMGGDLRALYVDTRALLGVFTEYVYLTGEASRIYDDVPRPGS